MLILLAVLILAGANGWTVPAWCWVLFAIQVVAEILDGIIKEMRRITGEDDFYE